jgi:uncharacterized membrane protein YgdD (TMEM256/DUF423 family)
MHDLDELYELCLKVRGDPATCSFGVLVERLIRGGGLKECVEKNVTIKCFERCVEKCGGGEECMRACHVAVDAAVARSIVRDILRGAVEMVIDHNLTVSMSEAVAILILELLKNYVDADCSTKTAVFHAVGIAIVELNNVVGSDLLLLLAPLISATHDCVGEGADEVLEEVRQVAGEETVAKISAALDSGEVAIKRVLIRFPPAR